MPQLLGLGEVVRVLPRRLHRKKNVILAWNTTIYACLLSHRQSCSSATTPLPHTCAQSLALPKFHLRFDGCDLHARRRRSLLEVRFSEQVHSVLVSLLCLEGREVVGLHCGEGKLFHKEFNDQNVLIHLPVFRAQYLDFFDESLVVGGRCEWLRVSLVWLGCGRERTICSKTTHSSCGYRTLLYYIYDLSVNTMYQTLQCCR